MGQLNFIGGKNKSGGAQIARLINSIILQRELRTYVEPFCGGLSVTSRIKAPRRLATDACQALITLYKAMQGGWVPPRELSRERWDELKASKDPDDPLTAFAGFGCSNFGSWFQGYAKRYKYTNRYVSSSEAAANSLTNKLAKCVDVRFGSLDYSNSASGDVVYCDPPYKGTMAYGAVPDWDPERFWTWARDRSNTSLLAVSEMQAPDDFQPLLTFNVQHRIQTQTGRRRQEALYAHKSQLDEWSLE